MTDGNHKHLLSEKGEVENSSIPPTFLRDLIVEGAIPYRYSCSQARAMSFALGSNDPIISAAWIACTHEGRFWHKNRGVPRGMRGLGSVFGSPECATWCFLSRGSRRPAAPKPGPIRGIPRFSCRNLVPTVYFLREEIRYLLDIRRIPKNPGLLVELSSWPDHSA